MGIIIIGANGHGRSTLAEAIMQIAGVHCEVMETKDLIDVAKEMREMDSKFETIIEPKKRETKTWNKDKFYHK